MTARKRPKNASPEGEYGASSGDSEATTRHSRQARYQSGIRQNDTNATLTVILPTTVKAAMDDAADRRGITRKKWLHDAITEKLERESKRPGAGQSPLAGTPSKACFAIAALACVGVAAGGWGFSLVGGGSYAHEVVSMNDATPSEKPKPRLAGFVIPQVDKPADGCLSHSVVTRVFGRYHDHTPEIVRQEVLTGCGDNLVLGETITPISR